MRIVLIVLACLVAVAVVAYYLLVPPNTFITFTKPGGGTVTFSRTSVSFEAPPDHYAANGFDHLQPYVSRLLAPTNHFKFLSVFTPDGMRGLGLEAKDGIIHADLNLQWRQETNREIGRAHV